MADADARHELHQLANTLGALLLEIQLAAETPDTPPTAADLERWASQLEAAGHGTTRVWSALDGT